MVTSLLIVRNILENNSALDYAPGIAWFQEIKKPRMIEAFFYAIESEVC
jgi:hypothetical protein